MRLGSKYYSVQDRIRQAMSKPQRRFRVSPNDSVKLPDGSTYYTHPGDYVFYSPNMRTVWLHTQHIVHEHVNLNQILNDMKTQYRIESDDDKK